MANLLDELIDRVEDPSLRETIAAEIQKLRSTKAFGLVYEKHLPECVRVPSAKVRKGSKVQDRSSASDETYIVASVEGKNATVIVDGAEQKKKLSDLVVLRQFGEPIYPGLARVSRVVKDPKKPFHTVINGENYHAVEALLYTIPESVDVLYLDPPYNSGARDWTYNNHYVDLNDSYRHSK